MTLTIASSAFGQIQNITFDDTTYLQYLTFNTISNPNNIWQVGRPQKNYFTSANSFPNAIVTDTINPYPINDTSQFIITHKVFVPVGGYCGTGINAYYKVNSDTVNDFGKIEFSYDLGQTWINILLDTNIIEHNFPYIAPVFSGNSNGWKQLSFRLNLFADNGDTVLFRFTFISDNIQTNKDGLMFDDIQIGDCQEGIEEPGFDLTASKVYPNPTVKDLLIEFENKNNSDYKLTILDVMGKIVKTYPDVKNSSININIQELSPGIYYYKLTDVIDKKYATGRFIKQ